MAEESDGAIPRESLRYDKILVYTLLMILYLLATGKLFRRHRLVRLTPQQINNAAMRSKTLS